MKNEATRELLGTLSEILTYAPDLRLGQLLGILADRADVPYTAPNLIVEVEDAELLQPAKDFLEVMRKRHEEIIREKRAVA